MKEIYFNIRPASRDRMWDTLEQAKNVCHAHQPKSVHRTQSAKKNTSQQASLKNILKDHASDYLINRQSIDKSLAEKADALYLWGSFPKYTKKPFIVELDNPYSLSYYRLNNFQKNRASIQSSLNKASLVTFMSETCRDHSLAIYGDDVLRNTEIVYPFVKRHFEEENTEKDDKSGTNFIFVAIDFRRKGGVELLEAFHCSQDSNIHLTVVADLPAHYKLKYSQDPRITFMELVPRAQLFESIYPKMDVMLLPSLHESFGMVLLEALSFGMAIITVNAYATHELVSDGFNGCLLPHPILKPTALYNKNIVNCVDMTISNFRAQYLSHNEFYYGLYENLKYAIANVAENREVMKKNSQQLFNEKFSPESWLKNFSNIIER